MAIITNCYTTAAGTFAIAMCDRRAESAHSIVSSFAIPSRQLNNDGPFQHAISPDLENLKSRFGRMLSRSIKTGLFENVETNMTTQFPVGGPREPVYNLMRGLGFSMGAFGDKTWTSADKITVQIYGAGSKARITDEAHIGAVECTLDDLAERIDSLRRG